MIHLVGSMIVRDELRRLLRPVVEHALTYCDELRVLDDGSTDGTFEWLREQERVSVRRNDGASWAAHEGRARQALLDWTLASDATHVLGLDADEFVPEGRRVRDALAAEPAQAVWLLRIAEVWDAAGDPWRIRVDGGWAPYHASILYRPAAFPALSMTDRPMAVGRQPAEVWALSTRRRRRRLGVVPLDFDLLHLGWADPATRATRARRYEVLDGGEFHAGEHLDSILWDDDRVTLEDYPRPVGLPSLEPAFAGVANL